MSTLHLRRTTAIFVVDCCQFGRSCIFGLKIGAYGLCRLGWWYNGAKLYFYLPYMIVSMIWNTSKNFSITPQPCHSHFLLLIDVNLALAVFLGWKLALMASAGGTTEQRCILMTLYECINDMKYFWNVSITTQLCYSHFCCWLLPIWP